MKLWLAAAAISLGCVLTPSAHAASEIKWTEEVQLHDGSIVQIKRRTELTSSGFPAQKRGFSTYHELCYAPLRLHWRSKPSYRPETFEIVNGTAYVKVPVKSCISCMLQGYPENDALVMAWRSGAWVKVDEKDVAVRLKFNLLDKTHYANDDTGDVKGLITLPEKRKRDFTIYRGMERAGRDGPYKPGICEKCKSVRSTTDATPEVFLPSGSTRCDW